MCGVHVRAVEATPADGPACSVGSQKGQMRIPRAFCGSRVESSAASNHGWRTQCLICLRSWKQQASICAGEFVVWDLEKRRLIEVHEHAHKVEASADVIVSLARTVSS